MGTKDNFVALRRISIDRRWSPPLIGDMTNLQGMGEYKGPAVIMGWMEKLLVDLPPAPPPPQIQVDGIALWAVCHFTFDEK